MANNSDDIRRLMNLLESATQASPTLLEGWVDNLKNKIRGNMGEKQRKQMASELSKEYYEWLGKTKREGNLTDMTRFMTHRIGFNDSDIDTVLTKAGFEPQEVDSAEDEAEAQPDDQGDASQGDEVVHDKKIKTGAELDGRPRPYDSEDGRPLPTDLDTKMSDYGDVGQPEPEAKGEEPQAETPPPPAEPEKVAPDLEVEKADNKEEPQEIVDDPKKYQLPTGGWDRKKISAKLAKMPMGAKLTLGTSTFRKTIKPEVTAPNDKQAEPAAESINEADTMSVSDDEVLPKPVVAQIMDAAAAQVNDEYLMNGPERDKDAMYGRGAGNGNVGGQPGNGGQKGKATPNVPGKAASGSYDAKEMVNILKTDFQINNAGSWVESLTRKVMGAPGIGNMSDNDMHDLALLGWALIRARN